MIGICLDTRRELFVALVTDGDAGTSLTPQLPTGTISVLPKPADAVTPARARVVPAEAARAARKVVMAESLTSASMDGPHGLTRAWRH